MKLKILLFTLLIIHVVTVNADDKKDSLINTYLNEYRHLKVDSKKVGALGRLSFAYRYVDFQKSFYYARQALSLSKRIEYKFGVAKSNNFLGLAYATVGEMDKALEYYLYSLKVNDKYGFERETGKNYNNIAEVLILIKDYKEAEKYLQKAYAVNTKFNNSNSTAITLSLYAELYLELKQYDKAFEKMADARKILQDSKGIFDDGYYYVRLGKIQLGAGNLEDAKSSFNKVLNYWDNKADQIIRSYVGLAEISFKQNNYKGCKSYLKKALDKANESNAQFELIEIYQALANLSYQLKDYKTTITYLRQKDELRNSLLGYETTGQITNSLSKIITEQKETENETLRSENKFRDQEMKQQRLTLVALIIGITITVLLGIVAFVNFNRKNKAYTKLAQANEIILKNNRNLEETIAKRTETILKHNSKLKELAYFNSHRIRKHLANIQGLIFLLEDEDEDKLKYVGMIEKEMSSLDHTITEINHLIDREI